MKYQIQHNRFMTLKRNLINIGRMYLKHKTQLMQTFYNENRQIMDKSKYSDCGTCTGENAQN